MGTKTLSVADDAYELLAKEKRAGESFSDVIRRLAHKPSLRDLQKFISPKEAEALAEAVQMNKQERTEARVKKLGLPEGETTAPDDLRRERRRT
ncbi:MAG: antitoxin VapB family protein [Euryarchaeota archaeon]|nr:antitoxin VapB family protein [Euryarchaeota archaeon]